MYNDRKVAVMATLKTTPAANPKWLAIMPMKKTAKLFEKTRRFSE